MRINRNSKFFCIFISFAFIPPLLLIIILINYLNESMRICLPFSFSHISNKAHQHLSCQSKSKYSTNQINRPYSTNLKGIMADLPISNGNGNGNNHEGKLAVFLTTQKQNFLNDLKKGDGKGWTVFMGNEAGDLDSIASSIGNAYLASTFNLKKTIPLILTPQKLMSLRPENLLALKLSSIPINSLLHSEQLPIPTTELSSKGVEFGLVDHNRLLPQFGGGKVSSIIDHHDDEHAHTDAEVREITTPTGSCASLVTKYFQTKWKDTLNSSPSESIPAELATLLLSSILIDTTGLKPGRKATLDDYASASFLYPLSTLDSAKFPTNGDADGGLVEFSTDGSNIPQDLITLTEALQDTKMDVSNLTTSELLLRDYKEYSLPTSSSSYPTLKVGLSTVPLGLKKWLSKETNGFDSFLEAVDEYMADKTLDIEGILTSFNNGEGKHKRELAFIVRSGGVIKTTQEAKKILEELKVGLEGSSDLLNLSKWDKDNKGSTSAWESHGDVVLIWKQGNAKSTRKQVAPLLRDVVAKLV
ncbi:uncharacterized protein I206_107593 [Kwoniella pini CBS 10737]|uniref:DHHA2 domain-containing protein n=1 Tax=Kwoniella pini CBS 10737 TaxID=1296096 RepID=A0A1B9HXQ6_9TREE|nr:uncharacterized protein I206_05926 [Kwoniella pini CBS 10737]OCF48059.1 hypothetical protein I206_05926 [Kwoniella pini CBS 10737]